MPARPTNLTPHTTHILRLPHLRISVRISRLPGLPTPTPATPATPLTPPPTRPIPTPRPHTPHNTPPLHLLPQLQILRALPPQPARQDLLTVNAPFVWFARVFAVARAPLPGEVDCADPEAVDVGGDHSEEE